MITTPMLRLGEFRHPVMFLKPTSTSNSYGESVATWTSDFKAFVAIYPLRGREYFYNQQQEASITHRIVTWYRKSSTGAIVGPKWRIRFNGRIMLLKSVLNVDEKNKFFEIMATESS